MFENVLHQQQAVSMLRSQFESDTLAPALLFHGPGYSGKLTAALELARALTCHDPKAPWSCRCSSCRQQRLLLQPNTLLLGSRYFMQEIVACAETVKRDPKDATAFLFVRAVRKLLKRFDPLLWQSEEGSLAKIGKPIAAISDRLADFAPDQGRPVPSDLESACEEIISNAHAVVASISSDNVPVHVVRSLSYWAHISSQGERKVAVVETADRLHEASRNALLKLLEEPPPGVFIVLVTTNKQAIIPTILSRVRPVAFAERDTNAVRDVLSRIFREQQLEYSSLREYFVHCSLPEAVELRGAAESFVDAALNGSPDEGLVGQIEALLRSAGEREAFRYYCERLIEQIRRRRSEGHLTIDLAEQWSSRIHEALFRHETLNIAAATALHALFERMRESACASLSNER